MCMRPDIPASVCMQDDGIRIWLDLREEKRTTRAREGKVEEGARGKRREGGGGRAGSSGGRTLALQSVESGPLSAFEWESAVFEFSDEMGGPVGVEGDARHALAPALVDDGPCWERRLFCGAPPWIRGFVAGFNGLDFKVGRVGPFVEGGKLAVEDDGAAVFPDVASHLDAASWSEWDGVVLWILEVACTAKHHGGVCNDDAVVFVGHGFDVGPVALKARFAQEGDAEKVIVLHGFVDAGCMHGWGGRV